MTESLHDPETGLLNEAYFQAALEQRVAAARRLLRPFSVALLDLDPAAEIEPRAVAAALRQTLRESDTACRMDAGGFGILLEDTPEDGAVWTVERVRRALGLGRPNPPVIWAGVASYPAHALEAAQVRDRARRALALARDWMTGRIEVAGAD